MDKENINNNNSSLKEEKEKSLPQSINVGVNIKSYDKIKHQIAKNSNNNTTNISVYKVARLDDICISFIGLNFNEYPILDCLPAEYIENVVRIIDLSKLLINRAAKHVSCEKLWERMSCERWCNCKVENHGRSWKRLYLERHIQNLLETYYPSTDTLKTNWNRLKESIQSSAFYVHNLLIKELPSHLDVSQILPYFTNLSSLNITYKTLDVGMNFEAHEFGMNLTDALNISKYLQSSTNGSSLSRLTLAECEIDDETIHILMGGLSVNQTIAVLNLSHNKIGDVGCRRIANWIKSDTCVIMSLDLSDNQIGDEGVSHLAQAMNCIKYEDLGIENVESKKIIASNLISLNLALNRIQSRGCSSLFKAIAMNETLQTLDISCNRISFISENKDHIKIKTHIEIESISEFFDLKSMLKINNALCELNLNGNPLLSLSGDIGKGMGNHSSANSVSISRPPSAAFSDVESQSENNSIFNDLKECLIDDNTTIIDLQLQRTGFSKFEIKAIQEILQPRKVRRKQSRRKKMVDKSWKILQTVLNI